MTVTKFYLNNSNVLSNLLYSCETWHLKTSQEKKCDAFNIKGTRKILYIKWNDFITNEEVWEQSSSSVQCDM